MGNRVKNSPSLLDNLDIKIISRSAEACARGKKNLPILAQRGPFFDRQLCERTTNEIPMDEMDL